MHLDTETRGTRALRHLWGTARSPFWVPTTAGTWKLRLIARLHSLHDCFCPASLHFPDDAHFLYHLPGRISKYTLSCLANSRHPSARHVLPPRPDSELLSFCSPPAAPQRGSLFLFIGFDSLNSTVNPTGHIIFWSTIIAYPRAFDMGLTHSRIMTCYIVHLKLISLGLLFQFSYAAPVLPPGMIVFQRGFTRPLLYSADLNT